MTTVITVPGVERRDDLWKSHSPAQEALEALIHGRVEACSDAAQPAFVLGFHPFVAAVHNAFCHHVPLSLSPDMLWLLIAQGLGRIVNEEPEAMRRHFVSHEGKVRISVRRDEFVRGSPDNDWPGVFAEFSEQIRNHIGDENHEHIVVGFSTTGPVERAANEIVLMDAMQSYFEYEFVSVCGIPEVRLEGTADDWQRVAAGARRLGERYDCGWWTDHLTPWLDRIAACAAGGDDPELWTSIYKLENRSGGPYATGWLTKLFPYLGSGKKGTRRATLGEPPPGTYYFGVTTDEWPGSLSIAPLTWQYHGDQIAMEFLAGFTHFTQDEATRALRPVIGWAVRTAK